MTVREGASERRCFLHIGPPKTGTTSLQQTLLSNADKLAAEGIKYPTLSANHQFLVAMFHSDAQQLDFLQKRMERGKTLEDIKDRFNNYLMQEIEDPVHHTLVLSSEHLTLLSEQDAKALITFLLGFYASVTVIAYVRHPISQVASFMQEQVKSGARRLTEVLENTPFTHYAYLIPLWVKALDGQGEVLLRVLEPEQLLGGDLITDFLHIVGFKGDCATITRIRANERLSAAAVLLADALNDQLPRFSPERAKNDYLSAIGGPRFEPPLSAYEATARRAAPQLQYLRENWDIQLTEPELSESASPAFDAEAISTIALLLNRLRREAGGAS